MYIIGIGWMYVVTLMAATETNLAAGLATFIFYGALPCAVLMYILGTKRRRARKRAMEAAESALPGGHSGPAPSANDGENTSSRS